MSAVSLPESMSFTVLARLPPQSFELYWVAHNPDIEPLGGKYDLTAVNRPQIHVRGAPNEYVLNQDVNVGGTLANGFAIENNRVPTKSFNQGVGKGKLVPGVRYGPSWFRSSRESFNSSALPFLDNQDAQRHAAINQYRGRCARRNIEMDCMTIDGLEPSNFKISGASVARFNEQCAPYFENQADDASRTGRYQTLSSDGLLEVNLCDDSDGANEEKIVYGDNFLKFKTPLGFYSSIVNSHSVLPVGLFSAYSINGYSLEWATELANTDNNQRGFLRYNEVDVYTGGSGTTPGKVTPTLKYSELHGLKIYTPMVRVLDPAVNQAIFNLYRKNEPVNMADGSSFPMSLRLNTIGYRSFSYNLNPNSQSDYYFRLPLTDKSTRAIMFFVQTKGVDGYNLGIPNKVNMHLTRLEYKIGSYRPSEVVENRDPMSDNIQNFIYSNTKASGYCFSPFPQYLENQRIECGPEHRLMPFRSSVFPCNTQIKDGTSGSKIVNSCDSSLLYGVISLENMDHREPDFATNVQASGVDTTNRGGIDIWMRFQSVNLNTGVTSSVRPFYEAPSLPAEGAEINFLTAYDAIYEVSAQGVSDITNSTL